jgi:predicted RNA-binding Zn ribbon-like protein
MSFPEWENHWDFDADMLPLDFANTAEWHGTPEPTERLNSFRDLVGWSWAAGLLSDQETQHLMDEARRQPEEAARIYARAIEIREAIYQVFSAIAADRTVPADALITLNEALVAALQHARVITSQEGFEWGWSNTENDLEHMLWPIVRSAADLMTSEDLERVGECADDRGCGYLFFDTTRNRSRRWCNMQSCGNRAKARRHYRRSKS